MSTLEPHHEELRTRVSSGELTDADRVGLARLLDQVQASTVLTEDAPLEDQSTGFWWGTMRQYRELVPRRPTAGPDLDTVAGARGWLQSFIGDETTGNEPNEALLRAARLAARPGELTELALVERTLAGPGAQR